MNSPDINPAFIDLCYVNGGPRGILRVAVKDGSGYLGYRIPRDLFDFARSLCGSCDLLHELRNRGIYFLVKFAADGSIKNVYVGKAGERKGKGLGVLNRISEHGSKEACSDWDCALCLTQSHNVFNATKLNYLEYSFHEIVKQALGAKAMYNGNTPTRSNPELSEKYSLDGFIKNQATLLLGAMGFDMLSASGCCSTTVSSKGVASTGPTFVCKGAGAEAYGQLTSTGFKILMNSRISDHVVSSFASNNKGVAELRKKLTSDGTVKNRVLTADCEMSSPSAASAFVLGRPSNGKDDWKWNGKKSLGDYLKLG